MGTRSRICQKGWAVWVTVVPYVENTLYSTNIYSCVRPVHTLYISYLIEHNGGDKPHDCLHHQSAYTIEQAGSFETSVSIQPT